MLVIHKVYILLYATGISLLEAKNAPILISTDKTIRGAKTLCREIPAAFIASNSLFSPLLPIVMIEAKSVARGSDIGINVADPHPKNSTIIEKLNPFPTSSSMYNHKNCIISTNVTNVNATKKGQKKDCNINLSSFFIKSI